MRDRMRSETAERKIWKKNLVRKEDEEIEILEKGNY